MRHRPLFATLAGSALLLVGGGALLAQDESGAPPVDSGGSYEISGVNVDVSAKTAEDARYGGWRLARRKAWAQLSKQLTGAATQVPDSTLDSVASGIVIQDEQIAPTRYIARLGVMFDRGRAGALLGVATSSARSQPMLVIPVQWSAGVGTVFENRSDWQTAWARYRAGGSAIDYVRPAGTGPDSMLLNVGQTGRPGRGWWRSILDEYGASDVLIPTVRLYRQYPGGPVIGVFQARHGPDNELLGSFTLRVGSSAGLPQLLDAGVKRIDDLYQTALRIGALTRDPSLSPPPTPAAPVSEVVTPTNSLDDIAADLAAQQATTAAVTIQFDTPSAGAVSATEAAVRGIPGVRSAQTTSLALGGVSLMRVTYDGDPDVLRTSLESRGFQVFGSGATLRIRRAPQLPPPDVAPDTGPDGGPPG